MGCKLSPVMHFSVKVILFANLFRFFLCSDTSENGDIVIPSFVTIPQFKVTRCAFHEPLRHAFNDI